MRPSFTENGYVTSLKVRRYQNLSIVLFQSSIGQPQQRVHTGSFQIMVYILMVLRKKFQRSIPQHNFKIWNWKILDDLSTHLKHTVHNYYNSCFIIFIHCPFFVGRSWSSCIVIWYLLHESPICRLVFKSKTLRLKADLSSYKPPPYLF